MVHPNSLKNLKPIKKGEVLNPNGRTRGSRSFFSESFCLDMLIDWEEHGSSAIQKVRETDPSTYLRVAASIVPKEFKLNNEDSTLDHFLEKFTEGELSEVITGLRLVAVNDSVGKGAVKEETTE